MKTAKEWEKQAPSSAGEIRIAFIEAIQDDARAEVTKALHESIKLQSHYAGLLNQYDGGERRGFADGAAWIRRLQEMGRL